MPKEEWGVKRVCPTTGKRFYDLGRDPVVSPYTGEVVPLDTGSKSRVLTQVSSEKPKPKPPAAASEDDSIAVDAEDVLDDSDDDADVDLGDDVLDDDDDGDNVSLDEIADMSTDDDDS